LSIVCDSPFSRRSPSDSWTLRITTNRAFKDWGTILDVDNTLATALIDRLMHHGEAIVIHGGSYRMKDRNDEIESPQ
jgi:DNA replication protein DnaC